MAAKSAEKDGQALRSLDPTINDLKVIETGALILLGGLFVVVIILACEASLTSTGWSQAIVLFLRVACVALVLSMASVAVGTLLGFLFGIPKILQHPSAPKSPEAVIPEDSPASTPIFITNTSLEEISDWLTKIIIGLGLVQFQTILHWIYVAAALSSAFAKAEETNISALESGSINGSTPVFFSIIISCLLASCLFTYLETRTRLTLMFVKVEHSKVNRQIYSEAFAAPLTRDVDVSENSRFDKKALVEGPAKADNELLSIPREQLKTATEIAGWASAQARAGNTFVADFALRDALQMEPGNLDIMLRLAEVFRIQENHTAHVELVRELIAKSPIPNAAIISVARTAQTESLYLPPPLGFTKSIEIASYLEKVGSGAIASVQLRKACAFGQKFKFLSETAPEDRDVPRANALAAARRVVELEPNAKASVRVVLRQVYDPKRFNGPLIDNDLEIFRGDPSFEEVIVEGKLD
jgi:hypothetical protein